MKFDVLEALRIAEEEIGHPVTINCSKDGDAYTVQMKVTTPHFPGARGAKVYGQQFAFIDHPGHNSEWYQMNEMFKKAVHSLKLQLEDNNDDGSM